MDDKEQRLLEARLSKLESQVDFLMKINGLDLSALRTVPDHELLKHYQDAVQLLALPTGKIPAEIAQRWSELFLQFSEYEMIRLQDIVEYEHTWEPIYLLCLRMMTVVRQHKELPSDAGLQQLYAILDRGRMNLRDSAIVMIKRHPETLPARTKVLLKGDDLANYIQ